jgi:DnaJ-class molecular chaperone
LTQDEVADLSDLADDPQDCFELAQILNFQHGGELSDRKQLFKALCKKWHPDKNIGNERQANEMFQLLQEKKSWFLAAL